jgi:UDP-N-acetylenolpyruvoylglucosamine reductase
MLRLDELKAEIKGEFFLQEELKHHDVKKVEAQADIIIKPAGKKDLVKALRMLEKSGFPHLVINSKGRVVFPDKRFHGAVIVTDLKLDH